MSWAVLGDLHPHPELLQHAVCAALAGELLTELFPLGRAALPLRGCGSFWGFSWRCKALSAMLPAQGIFWLAPSPVWCISGPVACLSEQHRERCGPRAAQFGSRRHFVLLVGSTEMPWLCLREGERAHLEA